MHEFECLLCGFEAKQDLKKCRAVQGKRKAAFTCRVQRGVSAFEHAKERPAIVLACLKYVDKLNEVGLACRVSVSKRAQGVEVAQDARLPVGASERARGRVHRLRLNGYLEPALGAKHHRSVLPVRRGARGSKWGQYGRDRRDRRHGD